MISIETSFIRGNVTTKRIVNLKKNYYQLNACTHQKTVDTYKKIDGHKMDRQMGLFNSKTFIPMLIWKFAKICGNVFW